MYYLFRLGYLVVMQRDLLRKLADELNQEITSERQVVYILVEVRKILEKAGELGSGRFETLVFCCNWVVHTQLSRGPSQRILSYFDDYVQKRNDFSRNLSPDNTREFTDFCGHRTFHKEFAEACKQWELPGRVCEELWWQTFLSYFCEVVSDCPIEAKASPEARVTQSDKVTSVTVALVEGDHAEIVCGKRFLMEWRWECSDARFSNFVLSPF